MADHEDYLSGEAPMAHHESHESLGSDEISVAGLLGVTAELAAHALIATAHQDAPALIAAHAAIAAAHHARYTDVEATIIANAQIAIHAAIPTAHQNAPALIATHKADASAHHFKYTDAEARALFSPITVSPSAFFPRYDTYDWHSDYYWLKNRSTFALQVFFANVQLIPGTTITKLTLYGYRDDAAATLSLTLFRNDFAGTYVTMANITSDWTTGYSSKYDDSIISALVDTNSYSYYLRLVLDPNNSVNDVKLSGAKIEFTG